METVELFRGHVTITEILKMPYWMVSELRLQKTKQLIEQDKDLTRMEQEQSRSDVRNEILRP